MTSRSHGVAAFETLFAYWIQNTIRMSMSFTLTMPFNLNAGRAFRFNLESLTGDGSRWRQGDLPAEGRQ